MHFSKKERKCIVRTFYSLPISGLAIMPHNAYFQMLKCTAVLLILLGAQSTLTAANLVTCDAKCITELNNCYAHDSNQNCLDAYYHCLSSCASHNGGSLVLDIVSCDVHCSTQLSHCITNHPLKYQPCYDVYYPCISSCSGHAGHHNVVTDAPTPTPAAPSTQTIPVTTHATQTSTLKSQVPTTTTPTTQHSHVWVTLPRRLVKP